MYRLYHLLLSGFLGLLAATLAHQGLSRLGAPWIADLFRVLLFPGLTYCIFRWLNGQRKQLMHKD